MNPHQQIVAARNLLERYGASASEQAKLRALELRNSGLPDMARFWFKVAALAHGKASPRDLAANDTISSHTTKC